MILQRTHRHKLSFVHIFVRYYKVFRECIFLTRYIFACSVFLLTCLPNRYFAPSISLCLCLGLSARRFSPRVYLTSK